MRHRIDRRRAGMDDAHAMTLTQLIIAMSHGCHVAQAGDHSVAEWAGDELAAWLNQRHLDGRVSAPDVLGAGRTTEAATDDHHPRVGLRPGPMHHPSSNRQPTNETEESSTREHLHSH